jgi:hypothetical protein
MLSSTIDNNIYHIQNGKWCVIEGSPEKCDIKECVIKQQLKIIEDYRAAGDSKLVRPFDELDYYKQVKNISGSVLVKSRGLQKRVPKATTILLCTISTVYCVVFYFSTCIGNDVYNTILGIHHRFTDFSLQSCSVSSVCLGLTELTEEYVTFQFESKIASIRLSSASHNDKCRPVHLGSIIRTIQSTKDKK